MNETDKTLALESIRKVLDLYRYVRHHGRKVQAAGLRGRELPAGTAVAQGGSGDGAEGGIEKPLLAPSLPPPTD